LRSNAAGSILDVRGV